VIANYGDYIYTALHDFNDGEHYSYFDELTGFNLDLPGHAHCNFLDLI